MVIFYFHIPDPIIKLQALVSINEATSYEYIPKSHQKNDDF